MTETDPVAAANRRYLDALKQVETTKSALFDVCAERVRSRLDTAETLAKPRTAFTAVTIRKAIRERGVDALPPGFAARKTRPKEGKNDG